MSLLAEAGDEAKLIAGGHSLLPMMKLRLAFPEQLIDVRRVAEASYIRTEGDVVAIGALTRHCDLVNSDVLRAEAPLIARVASLVGDPQVRHRGTIGGSLAHADPAADLPTAVMASDATLVVQGPAGRRQVPAAEFFAGYYETVLAPRRCWSRSGCHGPVPAASTTRSSCAGPMTGPIVAVATVGGRIALANMGSTPLRATAAEQALAGGASAAEAAQLAADGTEPIEDLNADRAFRQHLARVLTRRALLAAAG